MTTREPTIADGVPEQTAPEPSDPDPLRPSDDPNNTGETTGSILNSEGQQSGGIGGGGVDEGTQLTILVGDEMKWFFDASSGKWYVMYGLPESDRSILFEADPDQMDALFGENQRPTNFGRRTLEQLAGRNNVTFSGNIAEMEGEGRFEDEVRRIKTLALDSGTLPDWAEATGEVMDLVFIAQSEGKTQEWLLDQISRTQGFQERFPNLNQFRTGNNLTLQEAVTGFLEFEAGVKAAVRSIGGNPTNATPDLVSGLLNKGYTIELVGQAVAQLDRINEFRPALLAFNGVLEANGLEPIRTVQEMFDFMAGRAPADLYDIWEASSVSEAAAAAGLGDVFTAEDAMAFALETQGSTTLQEATGAFQSAAQMLLRLRHEVNIGEFGLDQDDIIDLSLGRAPRSGTSAADLQENINRAVLQAQGMLQERSQPFAGFTPTGTPQFRSLGNQRTEQ